MKAKLTEEAENAASFGDYKASVELILTSDFEQRENEFVKLNKLLTVSLVAKYQSEIEEQLKVLFSTDKWEILKETVRLTTLLCIKSKLKASDSFQDLIGNAVLSLVNHEEFRMRKEVCNLVHFMDNNDWIKQLFAKCTDFSNSSIFESNRLISLSLASGNFCYLFGDDDLIDTQVANLALNRRNESTFAGELLNLLVSKQVLKKPKLENLSNALFASLERALRSTWMPIRYQALLLITKLAFLSDINLSDQPNYFSTILPLVCLSRYIEVEGVKNEGMACWKALVGTGGIALLNSKFSLFLDVYIEELLSDHHSVREASCRVIHELFMRVFSGDHTDIVQERAEVIFERVISNTKHACWNVRESAFYCLTQLAKSIEIKEKAETLGYLSFIHLFDNVDEVRESSASCLVQLRAITGSIYERADKMLDSYVGSFETVDSYWEELKKEIMEYIVTR